MEASKPRNSPEQPAGQGRVWAGTQVRVLGPEDDLAGMLLQVWAPWPGPVGTRLSGEGWTLAHTQLGPRADLSADLLLSGGEAAGAFEDSGCSRPTMSLGVLGPT